MQYTRNSMATSAKTIQTEQDFKGHYRFGPTIYFTKPKPLVRIRFIILLAIVLLTYLTA